LIEIFVLAPRAVERAQLPAGIAEHFLPPPPRFCAMGESKGIQSISPKDPWVLKDTSRYTLRMIPGDVYLIELKQAAF
jgi:hypothetical protein